MATIDKITTAEQLLQHPGLGRCELVRGELVMMTPAGYEHGRVAGRIHWRLGSFVEQAGLGDVVTAEVGFQIEHDPDTVRAPDVAFVRCDRTPRGRAMGFYQGAPDLAVEVLSPSDRPSEVLAKAQQWLRAGCRAVWVVDPSAQTVAVYLPQQPALVLGVDDHLLGGEIVPGFAVLVSEIFGS